MKQRVVVQALIQKDDEVLLLRRSKGRPELIGKYELPGGRLGDGEQPDDALRRHIRDDTGLVVKSMKLSDVMSLENNEDGNVQHVFVVYMVESASVGEKIALSASYDRYEWQKVASMQKMPLRDSAALLMGVVSHDVGVLDGGRATAKLEGGSVDSDRSHVIVYSDGGSRGNPGPSSAGFVILDTNDQVIDQGGVYLGITTNNQAEYHGVQLGLERALMIGAQSVDFRIDSMLVVNQMRGLYAIKNRELWPIHERIRELIPQFSKVTFSHVPRENNQLADGMVNKILNEHEADII